MTPSDPPTFPPSLILIVKTPTFVSVWKKIVYSASYSSNHRQKVKSQLFTENFVVKFLFN